MLKPAVAVLLTVIAVPALAERPINIFETDCGVMSVYLEYPEIMVPNLHTFLDGVAEGLKATGMTRNSFPTDFLAICAQDPSQSITQVINLVFDGYQTAATVQQ